METEEEEEAVKWKGPGGTHERLGYAEFDADVTVTATKSSKATSIVSLGEITFENGPLSVEFFAPEVENVRLELWDGDEQVGVLAHIKGRGRQPVATYTLLKEVAGRHTYRVVARRMGRAYGVIRAGGERVAGFISVWRRPS